MDLTFIIKLIIFFTVLSFVFVPLVFSDREEKDDYEESKLHDLVSQKDIILGTILDLEYDYNMGKLSKKDYDDLKVQMKNEAAVLFKSIDEVKKQDSTDNAPKVVTS